MRCTNKLYGLISYTAWLFELVIYVYTISYFH